MEADRIRQEILSVKPTARSILDVGCGTGRHLPHLVNDFEWHGLDVNPELLAMARLKSPEVVLHESDMVGFETGRRYDAVICMFSSIAYLKTIERVAAAVGRFVRHLEPGGVVIIEPWYTPQSYWEGHVVAHLVESPDLKLAWMYRQERMGRLSILPTHYLVSTDAGIEHLVERHEQGLFTHQEMIDVMEAAGLKVAFDPVGFGRGIFVAAAPA